MTESPKLTEIPGLIAAFEKLRSRMLAASEATAGLSALSAQALSSATNLVHYAALRKNDLRDMQRSLALLGLSRLDYVERNTLAQIETVLGNLMPYGGSTGASTHGNVGYSLSSRILIDRTAAIFGDPTEGRNVRVMVTLPSEAATNYALVRDLVEGGMSAARINCAQGGPVEWRQMIAHLKLAEEECGKSCRVMMDLAGPKLRTGPSGIGRRFVRIRPEREDRDATFLPASVWLAPVDSRPPTAGRPATHIPVDKDWLAKLEPGDRVVFSDMRGKKRRLVVQKCENRGVWATLKKGAYLETGTRLKKRGANGKHAVTAVGDLPATAVPTVLAKGDVLLIRKEMKPALSAIRDKKGVTIRPAEISCTLPGILESIAVGDAVGFDDARARGVVISISDVGIEVLIKKAEAGGTKLQADKSINFPDSDLAIPPITEKDLEDLDLIVSNADIIGASYFKNAEDLAKLQEELQKRGAGHLGILLKIENRQAFEQLTPLLLTLLKSRSIGVIIARGDLAAECGLERIAEVQDEILRFCAAADVPALIATQVLENLSKKGLASRAEIIDATSASRAQCILLNKGPYIRRSLKMLDQLLRRIAIRTPYGIADLDKMDPEALFTESR